MTANADLPGSAGEPTATTLRTASDAMLMALEELERLELAKRDEQPGSEQFLKLARQIRDLAGELLMTSSSQEKLAAIAADDDPGGLVTPAISEVPPVRELHLVLAEWRDAERRLGAAQPGTEEALEAERDVRRLRTEYRTAHEQALRAQDDGRRD